LQAASIKKPRRWLSFAEGRAALCDALPAFAVVIFDSKSFANVSLNRLPQQKEMAKKKDLQDLTLEELSSRKKTMMTLMWTIIGLLIAFTVYIIYAFFTETWSPLLVVPMMLLVAIVSIYASMIGSINAEIKKRQS